MEGQDLSRLVIGRRDTLTIEITDPAVFERVLFHLEEQRRRLDILVIEN